MRFQKRIKVLPGLTLNLSKKGVSTSVGVTGARVTYGHGQKRTTVGLPGTGLSHTTVERTAQSAAVVEPAPAVSPASDHVPAPAPMAPTGLSWAAVGGGLWTVAKVAFGAVLMIGTVIALVFTLGGSGSKRRKR